MILKINKLYFLVFFLLLYSILPAFGKILENSYIYGLYIPLLGFIYFVYRKSLIKIYKVDIPFIVMFLYILFYIPISMLLNTANATAIIYGLVMFGIPLVGYFFSRLIPIEDFFKAITIIGILHAIFGILMYGFISYPFFIENLIHQVKDGTMAFRMSTFSGSLGLATLMIIAVGSAFGKLLLNKERKYIFITSLLIFTLIMTMQRSAWISLSLFLLLTIYYLLMKKNVYKFNFVILIIVAFILLTTLMQVIDLQKLLFIFERLGSLFDSSESPIGERADQWIGGINNFFNLPSGIGIGTTGQAARVSGFTSEYNGIPDGDYLRIISELGVAAFIFYAYLLFHLFMKFINLTKLNTYEFVMFIIVCGLSVNMIGSNPTEFHFVNFLYWMSIGYFFKINFIKDKNVTNNYSSKL